MEDGERLTLSQPEIQGDTLRGVSQDLRVGVALADIVGLETKHYRVLAIIGGILITPAVLIGTALIALTAS